MPTTRAPTFVRPRLEGEADLRELEEAREEGGEDDEGRAEDEESEPATMRGMPSGLIEGGRIR